MDKKLTEKEKAFCIEYCCNGFSAVKAALFAGYSNDTAKQIAHNMLQKEHIKEEIQSLRADFDALMEEKGITKAVIVQKNWALTNSSIANLHNTWIERKDFETLTDEEKACIQEIDTKVEYKVFTENNKTGKRKVEYVRIKIYNKQEALKEISKLMGWYAPQKTDLTIKNEVVEIRLNID
jgi:phage terminase small subunit